MLDECSVSRAWRELVVVWWCVLLLCWPGHWCWQRCGLQGVHGVVFSFVMVAGVDGWFALG